jgi:hypothetical protein
MLPKYRILTREELQELEKEFVEYLVLNGITAQDWVKMKEQRKEEAEEIIVLFSDVVFESIMRKVKFLESRGKKYIRIFQCLPEQLVMVAMEADENTASDFSDPTWLQQAMQNPPAGIKVYTTSKPYTMLREREVFEMTQTGCFITDDRIFKTLSLALGSA